MEDNIVVGINDITILEKEMDVSAIRNNNKEN